MNAKNSHLVSIEFGSLISILGIFFFCMHMLNFDGKQLLTVDNEFFQHHSVFIYSEIESILFIIYY